jgi:hypothetical protein
LLRTRWQHLLALQHHLEQQQQRQHEYKRQAVR